MATNCPTCRVAATDVMRVYQMNLVANHCVICWETPDAIWVLMPCGHPMCGPCAQGMMTMMLMLMLMMLMLMMMILLLMILRLLVQAVLCFKMFILSSKGPPETITILQAWTLVLRVCCENSQKRGPSKAE
jgi:hypothetical protein